MQGWTTAWHNADKESFKAIYSKNATIFPPKGPSIQGDGEILAFMNGGLGKVDVFFKPETKTVSEHLAFEYGTFKDADVTTGKIIGAGKYAVTWIRDMNSWRILCHTWSIPNKD